MSVLLEDTDSSFASSAAHSSVSYCSLANDHPSPRLCAKEEQDTVKVCGGNSTAASKESQAENLGNNGDSSQGNAVVDKTTTSVRPWDEVESCLVAAEGLLKDNSVVSKLACILSTA